MTNDNGNGEAAPEVDAINGNGEAAPGVYAIINGNGEAAPGVYAINGNGQAVPGVDASYDNGDAALEEDALKQQLMSRMDMALFFTRGLTVLFSFLHMIPMFWKPYECVYAHALAASAATSILILLQRRPAFQVNKEFFKSLLMEESFHYLMYSVIFFYMDQFILVLIPIFFSSLLHFTSHFTRVLDVFGPNSLWMVRLIISPIESRARSIVSLIALTELMLMPFCVYLFFTDDTTTFWPPFLYHQLLRQRYKSPTTRKMFTELGISVNYITNSRMTPFIVKKLINACVKLVYWSRPTTIAPPSPQ